jgi:chromosome segregation protein
MLKALELIGFKSFADRTRFEFPPGITVVVGPNGSGKSNIVDAIKWVLGEQSVKSLRGHEMADVIFNGSGTRRAMNSAEITLTFDNAARRLELDTPEVAITRRVYRGGEGEYLINRTPARLRDIRDLLTGTGLGTQAYSVIEQGKVDALLQSSPRDRRILFEEAAGISRFRVKKIEALRRLERVEQNLLRLHDIVDEVESRLKSVRAQAGKANRYKEYSDRLQDLRTQVALGDWRRLGEKLAEHEAALQALTDQRDTIVATAEAAEARLAEDELAIQDLNESVRQWETKIAANRERIAAQESAIEHERARLLELEQEVARHRKQLVAVSARVGDLRQQVQETVEAVQDAETHYQQVSLRLVEVERRLSDVIAQLDQIRSENEQRRNEYLDQMRAVAALGNEIGALESQGATALAARERCALRMAELDELIAEAAAETAAQRLACDRAQRESDEADHRSKSAVAALAQLQAEHAARLAELDAQRQRHAASTERAAVLEELERRQEGLTAGVKEVLQRAAADEPGAFHAVRGMVADLLSVNVEAAPLIEVALGPAAQYVVVEGGEPLRELLLGGTQRFEGRVGFLWLDDLRPRQRGIDLEGRPGVVGRADRFVETQPAFAQLTEHLLGSTWIVEQLSHAQQLAAEAAEGTSFVTLAGEHLAAHGALVAGPTHSVAGIISRRSQLRALQSLLAELDVRMAAARAAMTGLDRDIAAARREAEESSAAQLVAAGSLAEHRAHLAAAEHRCGALDQQRARLSLELETAAVEYDQATAALADARQRRERLESALGEMEAAHRALQDRIDGLEAQRQTQLRDATQIKVDLAKSEERLRNMHARLQQFEENRQERRRAVAESRDQLGQCARRAEGARWNILRAESEIAELYLHKESFTAETIQLVNRREELRQQRSNLAAEAQKARGKARKLEEKMHEQGLAAHELRTQRTALADRLRDEYAVELAELDDRLSDEQQHARDEVQQEIDELRRKINNLGNVNLEALAELEQLEVRHKTLFDQYNDLANAKGSLEKIISKINADSRRLFAETLEVVRGHFQQLFRDLFGGGQADIVLDQGVDILESGIEIVARPPGKEPRSISLLSGGEKTLTCVAMLLAIFRSRPSPFCVLDEVDAALDEANIDRFTKVLQDFLGWTQFIIVTHSKKTMTSANTIYGVTMQESGVSRQVSVRFEDVSDDGHIRPERLAQEQPDDRDEDRTQAA